MSVFKTCKKKYDYAMDNRKKQINELEQRKREQIVSLDTLLTRLGESLLNRAAGSFPDNDTSFEELAVYRQFKRDIADSEASIHTVEEQMRRFRELEESIEAKEKEDSAGLKELAVVYGRLGKALLEEPGREPYAGFCAPYRNQAEALLNKVLSLEDRLSGLEEKEGGNVFSWIGKNAQGLVLRSFLARAQENLELLHRNVGERYTHNSTAILPSGDTGYENGFGQTADIENLCSEIERRRAESRIFQQEISDLKEEWRNISVSHEGGPLRQIQTLRNHIVRVRDELKTLYRRTGAEAASLDGIERRNCIDSLIMPDDSHDLDSAMRINRSIHDDEAMVDKLQTSLAIDEEKSKIDKYRRIIKDKKDKIAQAEKSIMEFEESIRISESIIKKLQNGV